MEFFPDQALVRLRSRAHGTYLNAENDGVGVSLNPRRAYLHTAWWVHRVLRDDRNYILLHSATYGRYLALSRETSRVYTGHHANLTVQSDYEAPEQDDVLWEADRVNSVIVVMLHASHRVLSVSPSNTSAFRHAFVVDSAHPGSCGTMAYWEVETIPVRPEPPVILRLTDRATFRVLWRRIFYMRADDYGNVNLRSRRSYDFFSDSLWRLRADLGRLLNEPTHRITLCARAGSQGRLTPLVIDLPSNPHDMEIIVLTTMSPAALQLRYPYVGA